MLQRQRIYCAHRCSRLCFSPSTSSKLLEKWECNLAEKSSLLFALSISFLPEVLGSEFEDLAHWQKKPGLQWFFA